MSKILKTVGILGTQNGDNRSALMPPYFVDMSFDLDALDTVYEHRIYEHRIGVTFGMQVTSKDKDDIAKYDLVRRVKAALIHDLYGDILHGLYDLEVDLWRKDPRLSESSLAIVKDIRTTIERLA